MARRRLKPPEVPMPPYRWVACSAREFGPIGHTRHLARSGSLDTACGASATHPEIWRSNTTKPKCADCGEEGALMPEPTDTQIIEERSYGGYTSGPSTMGRTIVYITCPFCRFEVTAYLWSLAGSGKKCRCGAKLDAYGTAKKKVSQTR